MTFGDRLAAWRLDKGFTQTDVGKAMKKIDYRNKSERKEYSNTISMWECDRHEPSVYALCLLSATSNKSIDWWLQDTLNEIKKYINPNYISKEEFEEENVSEKVVELDAAKYNEDLWKEQHKGCKYKYRKGNFICELTAI